MRIAFPAMRRLCAKQQRMRCAQLPADAPQEKVLARQLRYALESMDSDRGEKIVALCDDGTYDTMPKELLEDDAEGEELWDDPDFTEQELGQEDDSDPEVKKKMMFAVTEALLDMALAGRGLITNRYALWDQAHDNRKTKPRIWREVMAILDEEEVRSAVDSTGMETLKDYLQHCAPRTLAMFFHTLADLVKDENLAERIRKAFPPLTTKHTLQEEENIRTYEAKKMYVEQYSIEQIIAMEIEEHDVLFANAEAHELTLSEHLRFFVMQKTKMNEGGKFDSFPELEDDASSD